MYTAYPIVILCLLLVCPHSASAELHLTGSRSLTTGTGMYSSPDWSPDGSHITYAYYRDGHSDIYTISADGTDEVNLTPDEANDRNPVWSPDGSRIAFSSDRDSTSFSKIYAMQADGSNLQRLTLAPVLDSTPRWSPGGTEIVFLSYRDEEGIWKMNADGSQPVPLQIKPSSEIGTIGEPAWSPDGTRIAFARGVHRTNPWGQLFISTISLMDPDGANVVEIAIDHGGVNDLSWSPDGTRMAYSALRHSQFYLFVIKANGTNLCQISIDDHREIFGPAWSPDGTQMVFCTWEGLWVVDVEEVYTSVPASSWGAIKQGPPALFQR